MDELDIEGATFENVFVNGEMYGEEKKPEEKVEKEQDSHNGGGGGVILLDDIFGNGWLC